jgi:soluble lytic murein transglycosylase-like protein
MPALWFILAALAVFGLVGASEAQAASKPRLFRPDYWPQSWPTPPAEFLTAVASAAEKYGVKTEDLIAIGKIESGFKPNLPHKSRPKTWAKIRNQQIGKSGKTWGEVYTEADCHAYGIMGVMPFNFVGVPGGLSVGTPLVRGTNITLNVHMAARLLKLHYTRTGDWISAYHAYNPGGGEEYYDRFRKAKAEFDKARGQS